MRHVIKWNRLCEIDRIWSNCVPFRNKTAPLHWSQSYKGSAEWILLIHIYSIEIDWALCNLLRTIEEWRKNRMFQSTVFKMIIIFIKIIDLVFFSFSKDDTIFTAHESAHPHLKIRIKPDTVTVNQWFKTYFRFFSLVRLTKQSLVDYLCHVFLTWCFLCKRWKLDEIFTSALNSGAILLSDFINRGVTWVWLTFITLWPIQGPAALDWMENYILVWILSLSLNFNQIDNMSKKKKTKV